MKRRKRKDGLVAIALFDIAHALDRLATIEAMKVERKPTLGTGYSFLDAVTLDTWPKEQK